MEKKYTYIRNYLLEKIGSGEFLPGRAIPSERELALAFQVNRMTVRKAIEDLMYEGLLMRRKGSGTFLTEIKTSKSAWPQSTVSTNPATVRIISCKLGDECNYGYRALKLEPEIPYWRMRRVRLFEGVPHAYEDIYFNPVFFAQLCKEDYDLGLRQLIRKYITDHSVTVYEDVEALLCLHNTAVQLKVETGSPILQIKSYFEQGEIILMHCRSYHPGDHYKYQSNRTTL